MVRVIAKEAVPSATKSMEDESKSESVKFTLQVKAIFRNTEDSVVNGMSKRQNISLFVFAKDLDCKCPKLKVKKWVLAIVFYCCWQATKCLFVFLFFLLLFRSYLILGNDEDGPANALGISDNSIVIEWKDEWYRRLRKYQRQSHTCD